MKWILLIIGSLWMAEGLFLILGTDKVRELYEKLIRGKDLKPWSIAALVIGAILIVCARASRYLWLVAILGVLAIAKGVYLLIAPKKQVDKFTEWWLSRSDKLYRGIGIVALVIGLMVLCGIV